MIYTENKVILRVKHKGYKLTPQRRKVISTIALSQEHLTPIAIYEKLQSQYPGIGLATVYRTLEILTDLGLVCMVHSEGNGKSYLLRRPTEHHHHLICSNCGTVIDFTNCSLHKLAQKLSRKTGFDINSHLLEFSGICPDCQVSVDSAYPKNW